MHTDDHQIYYSGENEKEVELRLNDDIKRTSHWCSDNHIQANKCKHQAMILQYNKKSNTKIKVMADESNGAEQISYLRLLGVETDNKLRLSTHIKNFGKRVSQRTGILLIFFHNIMLTSANLLIFKTAILSL